MIEKNELIDLLNYYGLDYKKISDKNKKIITQGNYKNIKEIIDFFLKNNIDIKRIENAPSILFLSKKEEISKTYDYLIHETFITKSDIESCVHILSTKVSIVKCNYNYLIKILDDKFIKKTLSILSVEPIKLKNMIKLIEKTIGLDYLKENGASFVIDGDVDEIKKILKIPYFEYNNKTKTYNKEKLTLQVLRSSYDKVRDVIRLCTENHIELNNKLFFKDIAETKKILELPYWKKYNITSSNMFIRTYEELVDMFENIDWDNEYNKLFLGPYTFYRSPKEVRKVLDLDKIKEERFKNLRSSYIFIQPLDEIEKILKLDIWNNEKYFHLLTPTLFSKKASEIKDILNLPFWTNEEFNHLLTPSIFNRQPYEITTILNLPYWKEKKFSSLLTSSVFNKKPKDIISILSLSFWKDNKYDNLLTPIIFTKNQDDITNILSLPVWSEKKFRHLLTPSVFNRNATDIRDILNLKFWDEEKFQGLLSPNLFLKKADEITSILSLPYWNMNMFRHLLKPTIFNRTAREVVDILELDCWKDLRFYPLLTSSVFSRKAYQIKALFELPYWDMEEYKPLLTSSIYMKTAEQITNTIEYLKENGLVELSYDIKVLYQMNFEQVKSMVKDYKNDNMLKKIKSDD